MAMVSTTFATIHQCPWCSQLNFNLISRLFPADTETEDSRWITEIGPHPKNKHGRVGYRVADAGKRFCTDEPPQCGFCRSLYERRARCWSKKQQDGDLLLGVSLRRIIWDDASDPLPDHHMDETVLFLVPEKKVKDGMSWSFCRSLWENFGCGLCVAKADNHIGLCREVRPEVNYDYINSWVSNCHQSHTICRAPANVIDLSLIDCRRRAIVNGHSSSPYLALSYLWGSTKHVTLEDGTRLPDNLPPVIADAIDFTLALGYSYIWVDQVCIDQKDQKKRMQQIGQMNLIYAGAEITLVAAAGDDADSGLPGVAVRPRPETLVQLLTAKSNDCTIFWIAPLPKDVIRDSKWATRGWTYQEGFLSRRLLVFTEDQVYFECGSMIRLEGVSTEVTNAEFCNGFSDTFQSRISGPISKLLVRPVTDRALGLEDTVSTFVKCLGDYSRRHLSFEDDRLNAFAGIINELESRYANIKIPKPWGCAELDGSGVIVSLRSLWGLPCITSPTAQLEIKRALQRMFIAQLCWNRTNAPPKPVERNRLFPSWSWLGWKGPGTFWGPAASTCDIVSRDLIFVDKIYIDFEGHRKPVEECWSGSGLEANQSTAVRTHALYLDVVMLPPEVLQQRASGAFYLCNTHDLHFMLTHPDLSPTLLNPRKMDAGHTSELYDQLKAGSLAMVLLGDVGSPFGHYVSMFLLRKLGNSYERAGLILARCRAGLPEMTSLLGAVGSLVNLQNKTTVCLV